MWAVGLLRDDGVLGDVKPELLLPELQRDGARRHISAAGRGKPQHIGNLAAIMHRTRGSQSRVRQQIAQRSIKSAVPQWTWMQRTYPRLRTSANVVHDFHPGGCWRYAGNLLAAILEPDGERMAVIGFVSQKGGVGKSALARSLARE
ncbi:MAG: hypothetical protein M3Y22_04015, partial [Pseudomonadota bacterium]|nr:hypothetical protein [Pseudomonadota bacterium]